MIGVWEIGLRTNPLGVLKSSSLTIGVSSIMMEKGATNLRDWNFWLCSFTTRKAHQSFYWI